MSKINKAIHEIHKIEDMAEQDNLLCHIHPLAKVIITLWYLALVMSFDKYNISGLLGMSLYPVCLMILGEISARQAFRRLKFILGMVCLVGIANPLLDRTLCSSFLGLGITAGMISMVTLVLKAGFAVFAAYILIACTTVEEICCALRRLHVPQVLVTVILLIYRYLVVLLKEAQRITESYSLRAPGQRGIHYKAWGTLAGQMLLRSMDRAEAVYESMTLRGFQGEFYPAVRYTEAWKSICYGIFWAALLTALRIWPVFELAGRLL